MQGHPNLGYMPDYVPASVTPSTEPPLVGGTLTDEYGITRFFSPFIDNNHDHRFYGVTEFSVTTDIEPALLALQQRMICLDCE